MEIKNFVSGLRTLLVASALVMAAPQAANAAIIFQSVADLTDTSKLIGAYCSGCGGDYRIFDQFTLSGSSSITGFSVALYGLPPYWPNPVDFSVWTIDGANLPGTKLFSQLFAASDFTSSSILSDAVIAQTEQVFGLTLGAGTYYVSFFNQNLGVWGYQGGAGKLYQQGSIFIQGRSAGFTLTGAAAQVPEPVSLSLFGLGLAGLGFARRRKS